MGSPSLLDRLRAARANQDHLPEYCRTEDNEEDEETLKLQLAAIEAKLKLKRLQQSKANVRRPRSPEHSVPRSATTSRLEVCLSPAKFQDANIHKSPGRVTLGIDKGLNAADVSLRKVGTVCKSPSKRTVQHGIGRNHESKLHIRSTALGSVASPAAVTSFSERMATLRGGLHEKEKKVALRRIQRKNGFGTSHVELEQQKLSLQNSDQPSVTRTTGLDSDLGKMYKDLDGPRREPRAVRSLANSHSMPDLGGDSSSKTAAKQHDLEDNGGAAGDASLHEEFSRVALASRYLPYSFLKRKLPADEFTVYRIPDLLKNVTNPSYEVPDSVINYVVFGILATKSSPLNHRPRAADTHSSSTKDWELQWTDGRQNEKKFIILTLTDLRWTMDLFLFGSAVPKYHRLTTGTLLAILNPTIMPPRKGREDTGAFSLALNDAEDSIFEIGKAKHLGFCSASKQDGQLCGEWVNTAKTSICEFHLNLEIKKTQGGRMGVNGNYGGKRYNSVDVTHLKGKGRVKNNQGFDCDSGSRYFAVGSSRDTRQRQQIGGGRSVRSIDPEREIFASEGQMLERDKADRLRKQLAAQEQERRIARELEGVGGGSNAGSAYLRCRPGVDRPLNDTVSHWTQAGALQVRDEILGAQNPSKKRAAESIRLSPMKKKKTRFVTAKGIREAGRESLGTANARNIAEASNRSYSHGQDEDDEDDLEII